MAGQKPIKIDKTKSFILFPKIKCVYVILFVVPTELALMGGEDEDDSAGNERLILTKCHSKIQLSSNDKKEDKYVCACVVVVMGMMFLPLQVV